MRPRHALTSARSASEANFGQSPQRYQNPSNCVEFSKSLKSLRLPSGPNPKTCVRPSTPRISQNASNLRAHQIPRGRLWCRGSHVLAHTRAAPHFFARHDNVQPPLGARGGGGAELRTDHREGAIDGYRSRRQRRRAQSEPVHASGQHSLGRHWRHLTARSLRYLTP